MPEEVYNYLTEYGFSNEELDNFEEENEKMFFSSIDVVKNNISFLEGLGLNKEDIINVFRLNPFMITVGNNRITALNKITSCNSCFFNVSLKLVRIVVIVFNELS